MVYRQIQFQIPQDQHQVAAGLLFRGIAIGSQNQIRYHLPLLHQKQGQGIIAARIAVKDQGRGSCRFSCRSSGNPGDAEGTGTYQACHQQSQFFLYVHQGTKPPIVKNNHGIV